tara:strand:+ start:334 stop:531 length:198 start_codon:yes stop_codon:yes gene_type:complete
LGIAFDRQILDGLNKISKEILQEKNKKQIILTDLKYILKINIGTAQLLLDNPRKTKASLKGFLFF